MICSQTTVSHQHGVIGTRLTFSCENKTQQLNKQYSIFKVIIAQAVTEVGKPSC